MQTSETFSAKRQIMQIITQWVPGSWAGNSKCPTPIWAETMSRHNEVMTPGKKQRCCHASPLYVPVVRSVSCRGPMCLLKHVTYWFWCFV